MVLKNTYEVVGEIHSSLPLGWLLTKIIEISYVNSGQTPPNIEEFNGEGDINFFKISDMNATENEIFMNHSKIKISHSKIIELMLKPQTEGTIIFPKRGGAIATNKKRILSRSSLYDLNLMGITPIQIPSKFIYYWLLGKDLAQLSDGSNIPQINHKDIEPLFFPLPPLPEQHRIVTKIEELFTQLDAGVASLKKVKAQLKRYRQAVLKAAFEGRLTQEWREQHKEEIEPADSLLKKISIERKKLANSTPSKLYAVDTTGLAELPNEWCWASLELLCDPFRGIPYGVIKLGEPKENGVPTLRSSNVRHLSLNLSDVKKIDRQISEQYTRSILKGDEVLVTVRGTLGGVVTVPKTCIGFNISREVALVTLMPKISPKYIAYLIGAPSSQKWMINRARGIAYIGVNLATLRQLPLPLMSEKEQFVLINEIERHISIAEEIENTIKISLRQAETLRQSILKRAFEGKLVPQDPNDEPASILLERIKAEKARYAAEVKKGKTL